MIDQSARPSLKLCVLGATGGVGTHLLRKAAAAGHEVTAFVRSPEKLQFRDPPVRVVKGDLLDPADLARGLEGQEVVLSAFGPRPGASDAVMSAFTRSLVEAMTMARVDRLVYVSAALLFENSLTTRIFGYLFFRRLVQDARAGESLVTGSSLAWSILRPPRFTDGPATPYRVRRDGLPPFGFLISRETVADYVLREAVEGKYVRQIVGVAK